VAVMIVFFRYRATMQTLISFQSSDSWLPSSSFWPRKHNSP